MVSPVSIDYCASDPCDNGGTCINEENGFTCQCVGGYTGENCTINIDDCALKSLQCDNGGTCVDQDDGFTCQCVAGYTDTNCGLNINDCASDCLA